MGKAKWLAVLLLWAPLARGQCGGSPCYTDNQPIVNMLTPEQAAAQGAMTTSLAVEAEGVGTPMPSHNLTVTPGVYVDLHWNSNCPSGQQCSAVAYDTPDGGITKHYLPTIGLNGDLKYWLTRTSDIGIPHKVVLMVTNTNGGSTQDVINFSVVAGNAPDLISQDGQPENIYMQINTSGGGGSMMNDFTECELDPIKCTNPSATHTPFTTLNLKNTTQGTSQINLKHQSGNIANATSSVSFGDSIILAANSNDILDFEEQDEVDCSLFGPISLPDYHLRLIPYQIFDKVDSYDGKVRFQVEPWCYNCCIPAKQGCPEPITLTDHVSYSPGGNPPKIPTFFYSLGFCANGNLPGMVSGQWECSPGLAIPFYGTGWIKAYCTPYENPPY